MGLYIYSWTLLIMGWLDGLSGSSGEEVSNQTITYIIYMLFWTDSVLNNSKFFWKGSQELENPVRRGDVYNPICVCDSYIDSYRFLIIYYIGFHLGYCCLWNSHLSPDMVHLQRMSSFRCHLPTSANRYSCYYGICNSW